MYFFLGKVIILLYFLIACGDYQCYNKHCLKGLDLSHMETCFLLKKILQFFSKSY